VLAWPFALLAHSHAIGEALLFDLLKASVIGRKLTVELLPSVSQFFRDTLADG
jgi:hypothetical protein